MGGKNFAHIPTYLVCMYVSVCEIENPQLVSHLSSHLWSHLLRRSNSMSAKANTGFRTLHIYCRIHLLYTWWTGCFKKIGIPYSWWIFLFYWSSLKANKEEIKFIICDAAEQITNSNTTYSLYQLNTFMGINDNSLRYNWVLNNCYNLKSGKVKYATKFSL